MAGLGPSPPAHIGEEVEAQLLQAAGPDAEGVATATHVGNTCSRGAWRSFAASFALGAMALIAFAPLAAHSVAGKGAASGSSALIGLFGIDPAAATTAAEKAVPRSVYYCLEKDDPTCWLKKPSTTTFNCKVNSGTNLCKCPLSPVDNVGCNINNLRVPVVVQKPATGHCVSKLVFVYGGTKNITSGVIEGTNIEMFCVNMILDDQWKDKHLVALPTDPPAVKESTSKLQCMVSPTHSWKDNACQRAKRYLGEPCWGGQIYGGKCVSEGSIVPKSKLFSQNAPEDRSAGYVVECTKDITAPEGAGTYCWPTVLAEKQVPCTCPAGASEQVQLCSHPPGCAGVCTKFPNYNAYFCDTHSVL